MAWHELFSKHNTSQFPWCVHLWNTEFTQIAIWPTQIRNLFFRICLLSSYQWTNIFSWANSSIIWRLDNLGLFRSVYRLSSHYWSKVLFFFSFSPGARKADAAQGEYQNNDIIILTSSPNFQVFLFFPFFLRARQADAAQGEDFGECKGENNEGQAELKMSKLLHISNLCSEILPIIVKNKLKIMTFCNSEVNPLQYDSAVENVRMSVRIWSS